MVVPKNFRNSHRNMQFVFKVLTNDTFTVLTFALFVLFDDVYAFIFALLKSIFPIIVDKLPVQGI